MCEFNPPVFDPGQKYDPELNVETARLLGELMFKTCTNTLSMNDSMTCAANYHQLQAMIMFIVKTMPDAYERHVVMMKRLGLSALIDDLQNSLKDKG